MKKIFDDSNQQCLFDFLNEHEVNTDPVIDDYAEGLTKQTAVKKDGRKNNGSVERMQSKKIEVFYTDAQGRQDTSPRILTDIRPVNQFANYLPKTTARILHGIRIEASDMQQAEYYLQNGSNIKDVIQNETQKLDAINALEKWKLSNYKTSIMDLSCGLMKQLSNGVQFEGVKPQFVETPTGDRIITSWLVTMTWPQVKKCTFGGLVDKYGNYRFGVGEILKRTVEQELIKFISQKIPPALLLYYYKSPKGFITNGEYAPIRIYDKNDYTVTFELDRRYFPFDFTDKGEPCGIAKSRYIINIAGVGSIFEIGHYHLAKVPNLPSTVVANRFYQTLMGAFQFQSLLGISLKNNVTDKENVATRKNGIYKLFDGKTWKQVTQAEAQKNTAKNRESAEISLQRQGGVLEDLFPKDVRKRQWGAVQEKGRLVGDMLLTGLRVTGLLDELKNSSEAENILVPSNRTGMQYLEQYPNLLLAKVEPITKL